MGNRYFNPPAVTSLSAAALCTPSPPKKSKSLRHEPPACILSFRQRITNSTPWPSKKEVRFEVEKEIQELSMIHEFSSISISTSDFGCSFRWRAIDCRSDSIPLILSVVKFRPFFEDTVLGRFAQSGRAVYRSMFCASKAKTSKLLPRRNKFWRSGSLVFSMMVKSQETIKLSFTMAIRTFLFSSTPVGASNASSSNMFSMSDNVFSTPLRLLSLDSSSF
mmetsp:Transcript_7739/g.18967  ORF Transcript_7739/g.18967 Transcript_7739/m.18967 type:complete len:220 (+) Transcript_7739:590-1249(+)